jgi:hypothetical protein
VRDEDRFRKIAVGKIETTMIGAISAIEEFFGEIISKSKDAKERFVKCRQKILDQGNQQKRNLSKEIDLHEIKFKKYTYHMPFKPRPGIPEDFFNG